MCSHHIIFFPIVAKVYSIKTAPRSKYFSFWCPDLQSKADELNRMLARKDGTPEKSLKEMKDDIQAMLAEMRKRQLGGKRVIAEDEME